MNILLIGNGFDLAHGLPTTYKDFMKFLKAVRLPVDFPNDLPGCIQYVKSAKFYPKFEQLLLEEIKAPKNPKVEELRILMENNIWIDYFLKAIGSLKKDGWIDFESEMSRIVQALDKRKEYSDQDAVNKFSRDLGPISQILKKEDLLCGYSNAERIERLLDDLDRLIRSLEIYLCFCLDLIQPSKRLNKIQDIDSVDAVLSFNYTNTFERLYQPEQSKMPEYCYIHGRAQSKNSQESNNMVLGIDEYLDATERNRQVDFVRFKKYYQRIFKQTDYNYTQWFHNMESKNLYIIGHSLDVTDKDVLQDVLTSEGVKTTIFYHCKQANATQIENLVKVLGYDTLNAYTRGCGFENSIVFSQLY